MFDVDIYKIIDWFIPPRKRKMWRRVWLRSLLSPAAWLQGKYVGEANPESFDENRTLVNYKLKHNGQVVYLRKVLNDYFDVDQRRITIYNATRINPVKIYRRAEQSSLAESEKTTVYRRSEQSGLSDDEKTIIYRRMEGSTVGGFVVDVPFEISDAEYYKMRALIEFYKLASKGYIINVNGTTHALN